MFLEYIKKIQLSMHHSFINFFFKLNHLFSLKNYKEILMYSALVISIAIANLVLK